MLLSAEVPLDLRSVGILALYLLGDSADVRGDKKDAILPHWSQFPVEKNSGTRIARREHLLFAGFFLLFALAFFFPAANEKSPNHNRKSIITAEGTIVKGHTGKLAQRFVWSSLESRAAFQVHELAYSQGRE